MSGVPPFQPMNQDLGGGNGGAGNAGQQPAWGPPAGIDPNLAAAGWNYGQRAFGSAAQAVNSNVSRFVSPSQLRLYFNVDHAYVKQKIALLLFPFTHRFRREKRLDDGDPVSPSEDPSAPDLYIPFMALVTYIVVIGLSMGARGSFTPEVMGSTCSTALVIVFLELAALKIGFLVLGKPSRSMLELLSYSGYKFVGITVSTIAGIISGSSLVYTMAVMYTASACGYFLLKTLAVFLTDGPPSGEGLGVEKETIFRLIIAALQLPISWLMGDYVRTLPAAVNVP